MAKLWVHEFIVAPKGNALFSFPVDMLRKEQCYPATENDSGTMAETMDLKRYSKGKDRNKHWSITLRARQNKDWSPTYDRWRSFSWEVLEYKRLFAL